MNDKTVDQLIGEITTPGQAQAIYHQAHVFYEKGDFHRAIVLYDKLLEASIVAIRLVNPFVVRKARAMAYCKVGRFAEAEQEFKRLLVVLKSHGGSSSTSQVMYWCLVARYKGDEKKAMDEWLKL